jgi:predicted lipase
MRLFGRKKSAGDLPSGGYCNRTTHAFRQSRNAYVDRADSNSAVFADPFTDAHAVATLTGDACATVAFRGSTSLTDWMHNTQIAPAPAPSPSEGSVHTGFLRQYTSLHARIVRFLESNGVKHVLLCGHSLGGALAALAAAALPASISRDLVTFGAPRVGNARFCDFVLRSCETCTRVVCDRDIVPLFPMAFNHVTGSCLHVDDDGKVTYRERSPSLASQAYHRFKGLFRMDLGVADHMLPRYAKGCRETSTADC